MSQLVLQVLLPVEARSPRDVSLLISGSININLNQAYLWIVQVSLYPVGIYQHFWMGIPFVFGHNCSFISSYPDQRELVSRVPWACTHARVFVGAEIARA